MINPTGPPGPRPVGAGAQRRRRIGVDRGEQHPAQFPRFDEFCGGQRLGHQQVPVVGVGGQVIGQTGRPAQHSQQSTAQPGQFGQRIDDVAPLPGRLDQPGQAADRQFRPAGAGQRDQDRVPSGRRTVAVEHPDRT